MAQYQLKRLLMALNSPVDKLSDEHLLREIRHDPAAFEVLFKRHFTPLCAYCRRQYAFDLDLAKEAVHTAFIKLWENRRLISPELSCRSYLYKIVSNTCIDLMRQGNIKRKHERDYLEQFKDRTPSHDFDEQDLKLLKEIINRSVAELPEKMRIIFQLSRSEGLKYQQIADRLNLSVKTVETQMYRALIKLRQKLNRYFISIIPFLLSIPIFLYFL